MPKRTMQPVRQFRSIEEQAARWGVSESFVRKLLVSGQLEGVRAGRRWLIPLAAEDRYLKASKLPPPPL